MRQVDLIIAYDLVGKQTQQIELEEGAVRVPGIDDLIDMKRRSGRAQDVADVEALCKQTE